MNTVVSFYETVASCTNTVIDCPNTVNNPSIGWLPRGFYTEGQPKHISLLLVAKNPGHPLQSEQGMYHDRTVREIVQEHMALVGRIFSKAQAFTAKDNRSLTFHKNVLEYAGYFLDVPAKDVFKQCVYTNLVKCSTTGERDRLHPQTQQACFCRHFQREVAFFNPRAIVAFGREAYRFLVHPTIYSVHHRPVVYVKHPSYPYSKAKKDDILASIKSELKEYF